ncbi:GNAT family N-acetyltransferase [Planomicrobium sp. CPCC 101110]|uniref:GNAT family N-acetyltransferase n=1 Tax=Planomicrobium sp. CPCC 101110 TaxID=2599619 RepID=UPI0011B5B4C6|nr:GNAT family N-acetyltransferase [Planomicrobium sp. CPCC 101110]TWT25205.1 GNAT family N-acetyltransferase [Planomicrobium sp. CPCC 101110]
MEQSIRRLALEDLPCLEAMETGIEDDYVKRIFKRLVTTENNRLYGLFLGERLTSVCGYTTFAGHYAMIGRIRSDIRFRGKDLATQLTLHVRDEAFKLPHIQWVGANTQEENLAARRVLEKNGFSSYPPLYGAIAKDLSKLVSDGIPWKELHGLKEKQAWLDKLYIRTGEVFPYECYYPFPASKELFSDAKLAEWSFYENPSGSRVLITKQDFKKDYYLHAIYPWDDPMEQEGLWETISADFNELASQTKEAASIWMDLTKDQAQSLPDGHSFKLPSPWLLHGIWRKEYNNKNAEFSALAVSSEDRT